MNALIGHTGFVGSNILKQNNFDRLYNSKNISNIRNNKFDLVVCAGVSSVKWKANKNPKEDYLQIIKLINDLDTIKFDKFVLISTIAVYDNPTDNAYGRNRLYLENYLINNYENVSIIRLPSLFGDGLKKNSLYDLKNNDFKYLPHIDSTFQYYHLEDIWSDIMVVLENNLNIVNLATTPIKFSKVLDMFSCDVNISDDRPLINEDMRTIHSSFWGKKGHYLYTEEEVCKKLEDWICH